MSIMNPTETMSPSQGQNQSPINEPAASGGESKIPRWLKHTKFYTFEFFMALLGVLIVTYIIAYSFFILTNYLYGLGSAGNFAGQSSIWTAAVIFVFLPITMFFHARSSGESLAGSDVAHSKASRFFLYAFLFLAILSAIGFTVAAVYVFLSSFIRGGSVGETFIREVLPSLLSAAVFSYAMVMISRKKTAKSVKVYSAIFVVLALAMMIVLPVLTAGNIRNAAIDDHITSDLTSIEAQINDYASQNKHLPDSLAVLNLSSKTKNNADTYNYKYTVQGDGLYQLCAEFKTDTAGEVTAPESYADEYNTYAAFYTHESGHSCFKLKTSTTAQPAAKPTSSSDSLSQ